jgi:hypothetical protein
MINQRESAPMHAITANPKSTDLLLVPRAFPSRPTVVVEAPHVHELGFGAGAHGVPDEVALVPGAEAGICRHLLEAIEQMAAAQ